MSVILERIKVKDNGSRELFVKILQEEEDHINWIESQQSQINQMGISGYLSEQID